jgi:hypothetical protein
VSGDWNDIIQTGAMGDLCNLRERRGVGLMNAGAVGNINSTRVACISASNTFLVAGDSRRWGGTTNIPKQASESCEGVVHTVAAVWKNLAGSGTFSGQIH